MMLRRSRRSLTGLLFACLAVATACSDDDETTAPLRPAHIAKVSGDPQAGVVNAPLAEPLRVKVTAANDQPVPGVTVTFATTAPGASLSETTVQTDEQGEAQTSLTLGSAAGDQTVTATAEGVNETVTFTATAAAATVLYAVPTQGADQAGLANQPLFQPVTVTVIGSNSAPLPGVPVTFTVTSGGGSVDQPTVTTDANGQATVIYTLGPGGADQVLTATVPGLPAINITATIADPCVFEQPHGATFAGQLAAGDCPVGAKLADLFAIDPSTTAQNVTVTSTAFAPYVTMLVGTDTVAFGQPGENSQSFTLIPAAGARISVTSEADGATGAYTFSQAPVADITNCDLVFVMIGSETTQQVSTSDCAFPADPDDPDAGNFYSDDFTIFLHEGETVAITEAPEALDAFITLFGPDGAVVATEDQGGGGDAETMEFTAEADGFYTIDAGTFDPEETGAYTLTIEAVEEEPAP